MVGKDLTHIANKYVGLPFLTGGVTPRGVDCRGLVQLVLNDHLPGAILPVAAEDADVAALRAAAVASGDWRRVETPKVFDVVCMVTPVWAGSRIHYPPLHLGIMIDRDYVLHIDENQTSKCLPVQSTSIGSRLDGFYRHKSQE